MPRYDPPASLQLGIDGFLSPDLSTVELESPSSEHSGTFAGGLITVSFSIHDFTSYHGWEGEVDLMDIPADSNWKFMVTGAAMWFDVTYSQAGISQAQIGSVGPGWSNIMGLGFVPSGTKTCFGELDTNFVMGRYLLLNPGDSVKMYWSTNGDTTVAGGFSVSFWGYTLPDLEAATS